MKSANIKKLTLCALMSAVTAVLSQISIPTPFGIPITLQTFGVCLCGYLLGVKYGTVSILVYILLGVTGIPVFSGFKGGLSVLFGMTGGYIIGFIPLAVMCGLKEILHWRKFGKILSVSVGIAGITLCHLCGAIQFAAISGSGFFSSLATASLPFIPKDIISCILAYLVSVKVTSLMQKSGFKF